MEDLRDKVFQTHNEVTIRNGRKCIVIADKLVDCNCRYLSNQVDYNLDLIIKDKGCKQFDIMKVYNPITKELVFDRKLFVDWSKVAVDTKILVSDDNVDWYKKHFAKFEDGIIYAFYSGATQWSNDNQAFCHWNYAKLAESEVK